MRLCKRLNLKTVYDNYLHQLMPTDDGQKMVFTYVWLLNPQTLDRFNCVTIMSAMFHESLLYLVWSKRYGVQFEINEKLVSLIQYPVHLNGHRLKLHCVQDEHDWISSKFDSDVQEACVRDIVEFLCDVEGVPSGSIAYRYTEAIQEMNLPDRFNKLKLLPGAAYGLNNLIDVHHIIYLQTQMPHIDLRKYIEDVLGITYDEIRTAFYYHLVYQSVMRCNIRAKKKIKNGDYLDVETKWPVHIYLGDAGVCRYIAKLFNISFSEIEVINSTPIQKLKKEKQKREIENQNKKSVLGETAKKFCIRQKANRKDKYPELKKEITKKANEIMRANDCDWGISRPLLKAWLEKEYPL
ncbi:MAG: hypothetical protein GY829_00845 [Gammaproteobacteria bacterium]|nr:hypothetical protein [Gammaproteobacteria bacterium]